ncbi:MAG: putative Phosphatidylinositol alpha-mannosyltransferase [Bacteroidetes bacterium]|nr:putative Phosphatidylinositol alpha-mannosyltransferase [Bacteroidota bacterium]
MNILLSDSTDIFAGGEDYVLILSKYLVRRGHAVWVSANPAHLLLKKCEASGIQTVPIPFVGMSRVFGVAGLLRAALREHGIDIIHSNANYDRTCAALASAFLPVRHIAGVHSAHSIQHNITHWMRNRWGVDQFIADAEAVKSVLVREDRIPASLITVVPIGVESGITEDRASVRAAVRAELGIAQDTIAIGNVARLVPFKGHKGLLEAAALVVRERRDVVFPIVGDGELLDILREQARSLGIERQVLFLGFRDDLDRLYTAFDIYCHSSLELAAEAFPLAILRALSSGLPVVCTNVGGIAMMVEDGISGFLCPPEDPASLGDALLKVIKHPALRESMGHASLHLFTKRFHAEAMAEKVEKVYEASRVSGGGS